MAKKTIYLIRHGETDLNRYGIVQGQGKNPSLNAHGKDQARAFFHAYKEVPFDAVYTSILKRSIETIQPFIDSSVPHYTLSGLNEINWGVQEGKRMLPEREQQYAELIKKWQQGQVDVSMEGGESPSQVATRQRTAIQTILQKTEEKNILICMHGRAIRILLCQLLNYPLSKMDIFTHSNLSLYVLRYTGSMCYMSRFNDTSHLNTLQ